ncbi:hypothetical protein ABC977_03750 [Thioalkalicoccus limnaeus]|uniref:LPS-assembly lipoprotein LptE n=1 Tax=Thioalkalicoccus limnaeus TaxID=120681 RepID=A0ABV4BAP8_9GAMM
MRERRRQIATIITALFGGILALGGCSSPREDVRVTLCKDLVLTLTAAEQPVTWTQVRADPRGVQGLTVDLAFQTGGAGTRATSARCQYRYNVVDDTALTLADPMSAYSTSPYRMTLGDREIQNPELAQAIAAAMRKQGREFIDRAREGLDRAAHEVRERLEGQP